MRSGRQAVEEKEEKRKDEKKERRNKEEAGTDFRSLLHSFCKSNLQNRGEEGAENQKKERRPKQRKEKGERSLSLVTRGEKAEALSINSQVIFGIQNKQGFADSGGLKEPGSPADQVSRVSTIPVFLHFAC